MARYIDADVAEKIIAEKAKEPDYQHEGEDWKCGLCIAETAIEETPTANVAPRAEVARLIDDFQRSIRSDAKIGMSAGEILLHINNMLAALKKKYTQRCPDCKHFVGCECFSGQTCDQYEERES